MNVSRRSFLSRVAAAFAGVAAIAKAKAEPSKISEHQMAMERLRKGCEEHKRCMNGSFNYWESWESPLISPYDLGKKS